MTRSFLALGGNVGPVERTFRDALDELHAASGVSVARLSRVYRTAAVGEEAGGAFRNAAAELRTERSPWELLELLQSVETRFGRQRDVRWGPRPLDLDLIFYGDEVIEHPRLRVPHPACWYRRFVLDPLADIAADVVHPEKGLPVAELRSRLLIRPLPVGIAGGGRQTARRLVDRLGREFPEAALQLWRPGAAFDPVLLLWLGPSADGGAGNMPFEALPHVPRLDASTAGDAIAGFLRHVLQSALPPEPALRSS